MNCHQVRAFIDRRPTPAFGRPDPGEVRQHIEVCAGCREDKRAGEELESRLARLVSPPARASIVSVVMTRIDEEIPGERQAGESNAAVRRAKRPGWGTFADGVASTAMFIGIGIGTGAAVYRALTSESIRRLAESAIGTIDPTSLPASGSVDLLMGTGVLLYLAGLIGWNAERPRSVPRAFRTASDRHSQ